MEKCLANRFIVEQAMKIRGFLLEEDLYRMIELMDRYCPDSDLPIAEIGVYSGRVTRVLSEYGSVICVDNNLNKKEWSKAHIDYHMDADCWLNSSNTCAGFAKSKRMKFKCVFIDADHSYRSVKQDISKWSKLLTKDGFMFGDDYLKNTPGVRRAVKEYFGDRFHTTPHGKLWYVPTHKEAKCRNTYPLVANGSPKQQFQLK